MGDVKLNIIDTPGYADFFSEVRAACSVADSVVVVVSAVEGIEAQTEAAWSSPQNWDYPGWCSSTSSIATGQFRPHPP